MNRRMMCTSKKFPSVVLHITNSLEGSPSCPLTHRRERQVVALEVRVVAEQVKRKLGRGDMVSH